MVFVAKIELPFYSQTFNLDRIKKEKVKQCRRQGDLHGEIFCDALGRMFNLHVEYRLSCVSDTIVKKEENNCPPKPPSNKFLSESLI